MFVVGFDEDDDKVEEQLAPVVGKILTDRHELVVVAVAAATGAGVCAAAAWAPNLLLSVAIAAVDRSKAKKNNFA